MRDVQKTLHFESKRTHLDALCVFILDFRENPQVWVLFKRFSTEALKSNRKYFGARMIGERIRWFSYVETSDPDFKISNNHWPYYARLLMLRHPEQFAEFFARRDATFDVDDATLLREVTT